MRTKTFLLTRITDLLMHSPSGMKSSGEPKTIATKSIPTPEVEAAAGRYVTQDGYFWIPTQGIKNCMVSGAAGRRIGKRAATSVLKGTVFPLEDETIVLDQKTLKPMKADRYTVDMRRVTVDKKGIIRSRPRVTDWAAKVVFELDDMIPDDIVVECLNMGGRTIGILDYRPEKSGSFGRFKAELVK